LGQAFNLIKLINGTIELVYKPFDKFIPPETFRYAMIGGFNTLLDIFLYFCFYNFILKKSVLELGFIAISPHIAAFLFVFPITFSSGFLLSRYVTFTGSMLRGRVQLYRYAVTVAGSIILNYVLLKFFVEYLFIWPTVSKLLTTIVVVAYSYAMQRYYTFVTGTIGLKNKKTGKARGNS
jgi:putative flippase GtrA